MKLDITKDTTIGAVQTAFSEAFPYLKLVFFTKAHEPYKGSAAKFMVQDKALLLASVAAQFREGNLYVEPEMPVWQLERLLETEYGLHTQVFRRSGNTWLETSVTDDLSLEQQNAKGKASEHVHFEFVDPLDYREQD